tara:strand:- start:3410 stop:4906 length:1497 start_codon:yes stop_codon:yes gene_type:complete
MYKIKNIIVCIALIGTLFASSSDLIERNFIASGKLDGMVRLEDNDLQLIQLNLKNDSIYNIANDYFPKLELFNGPASYHRIIPSRLLNEMQQYLDSNSLLIIDSDYQRPDESRLYWTETKQGSNTYGAYSNDDAIEYTCACIGEQTNDCVKLGYDDSWYNPFDYYGEAWWGFVPPYHDYIQEIRVTVRGAQCDDLPIWSETYMGLKDDNGNWSNDYELSVNYADNTFIVPFTFNQGILMPTIGSEDNYVIDFVRFDFFYSCIDTQDAVSIVASDQEDCSFIEVNWELDDESVTNGIRLYRDSELIFESNNLNESIYIDYSAQENTNHEYCIETLNDCSSSDWICNIGSLKNRPESVSDVFAQDGDHVEQILVTWNSVEDVEGYRVYRDEAWMSLLYPHQDLEYLDIYIEPGLIYNYCIESYNDCGNSNWVCDTGFSGAYLGDGNFDGSIDILDVVTLVNFILLIEEPNDNQLFWMDINQDSFLNIQDVVLIVNIILDE